MNKTKIDWADASWNPMTGCLHGCPYCYARQIAHRFGGHHEGPEMEFFRVRGKTVPFPFGFRPTLYEDRLNEPQKIKKGQTIFVCSMADLFGSWVPDSCIQEVFAACEAAPHHRYLFLTKHKDRYLRLAEKGMLPQQHWYGYSATSENDLWRFYHADECPITNLFVSIEPILAQIQPCFSTHCPADWVIIGAETGNRKGKVVPKREWIERVAMECTYSGRPIFMKSSIRELMGPDFRQEYPWEARA